MSALRFITESSGSSITSFSMTDVFSSDFDIYKVVLDTIDFANADLFFRFINSSGSIVSASNYDDAVLLQRSYGAFGENRNLNATSLGSIGFSDLSDKGGATVIYIFNPTSSSSYTFALWQNAGVSSIGTPVRKGIGVLKQTASMTGINFNASSSILNIRARVYGLRVDN